MANNIQTPRIEIWSRDVDNTPIIPFLDSRPQHLYMLKINVDGTREIIRGGPSNNNMAIDNFKMVSQSYNGLKQDDGTTDTLDYFDLTKPNIEHHQLVTTYNFGSQELLDKSNNKGFVFDNQTNIQEFDYEVFSQNSNTGIIKRLDYMGLNPDPIYNSLKNKNLIAPAAKKNFSHSIMYQGLSIIIQIRNYSNITNY